MRPIGGWLFGHLADHHGRRNALMLSVLLMCFGSLIIAVTPTYASIGAAAPVLLGLARIIQGLSLGGEYGASATYLTEVADDKHRGFYVSFHYVTLIGGQLCAILVLLVLQQVFLTARTDESLGLAHTVRDRRDAGHRSRSSCGGTCMKPTRSSDATDVAPARELAPRLLKYPRQVLIVVGLTAGGTTAFYTYTTYMQKFLKLSVGLTDNQTTMVSAGSLDLRALPAAHLRSPLRQNRPEAAADLVRRDGDALHHSAASSAAIGDERARSRSLLIAAAWMIVAGYTSINAVVKAELFPTKVRATGVGLPYAVTTSIFGGPAESIALWFKSIGHEVWFSYYLTCVIAVSLARLAFHARHEALFSHWPSRVGPDSDAAHCHTRRRASRDVAERGVRTTSWIRCSNVFRPALRDLMSSPDA